MLSARTSSKMEVLVPPPPVMTDRDKVGYIRPPSPPRPGEYPSLASGDDVGSSSHAKAQQVIKAREPDKQPACDSRGRVLAIPPDPHPVIPGPPNVLTEDDYAEVVGALIERDFFPDLPQLRVQHELMRARLSGDPLRIRAAEEKLRNLPRPTPGATPMRTPAGSLCPPTPISLTGAATPLPHGSQAASSSRRNMSVHGAGKKAGHLQGAQNVSAWEQDDAESVYTLPQSEDLNHTRLRLANGKEVILDLARVRLDDFQRVFTSEDNASFEEILRKDMARLSEKEGWMELAEQNHNTTQREHAKVLENGGNIAIDGVMFTEFSARNNMFGYPSKTLPLEQPNRPRVDFTNTRFTTKQQDALETRLAQAVYNRKCRIDGEKSLEEMERLAQEGNFDLGALRGAPGARAIAGRICSPMPDNEVTVKGYGFLKTPSLLPGENGLSPLMTYGKIASTPTMLEDDDGPKFRMEDISEREKAADKLQRAATQQKRETKQLSKTQRLRALGITPASGTCSTPGASRAGTPSGGNSSRRTPGSISSSKIVTSMSPIGQLINRAKRMAQEGGRLGIVQGGTPTPVPGRTTPRTPSMDSGKIARSCTSGARTKDRRSQRVDSGGAAESEAAPMQKRARVKGGRAEPEELIATLPASITDGLLS